MTPMTHDELNERQNTRVTFRAPVKVSDGVVETELQCVDVSDGGLGVRGDWLWPVGDMVTVRVVLGEQSAVARARVIHAEGDRMGLLLLQRGPMFDRLIGMLFRDRSSRPPRVSKPLFRGLRLLALACLGLLALACGDDGGSSGDGGGAPATGGSSSGGASNGGSSGSAAGGVSAGGTAGIGNAGAGGASAGAGGSGSTGAGGGAGSADWSSRISGPEVVWYHDFETTAEVDAFRWTSAYGNDPLGVGSTEAKNLSFVASEGVAGNGCLEILRPAGTDEVGSHWWRPLSPIVGTGNGRGLDDPGASGTISAQAYASADHGSQISSWGDRGFYGHSSYHGDGTFDGTEYYLQLRVKMDPRRASAGMPAGGKLTYQTRTDLSFTTQEIVTYSGGLNSNNPGRNYLRMYGGGNTDPLESKAIGGDGGDQPNNANGLCELSDNPNTCWAWSGGWDTIMYHLRPGRADEPESLMEVYAAHEGETTYTKVWDMTWANDYGSGHPFGYNALILSTYMNGQNATSEFWHRYDQIILSRAFIPCPQE